MTLSIQQNCPPPAHASPVLLASCANRGHRSDGVHKLKEQESPHLIAGLVVWHLKRQPEPLVPYSLYALVVAAGAGAAAAAEAAARRLQQHDEQDEEGQHDPAADRTGDGQEAGAAGAEAAGAGAAEEEADRGAGSGVPAAVAAAAGEGADEAATGGGGGVAGEDGAVAAAKVAGGGDAGATGEGGVAPPATAEVTGEAAAAAAAALDAEPAAGSNSSPDSSVATAAAAAVAAAKQQDGAGGDAANTSDSADVNGGTTVVGAGVQDANAEETPATAAAGPVAAGAQETEVVPGPLWERGGSGPGGVDWGRQRGVAGRAVEAGAGGAGASVMTSPSAHGGEWDVGDGTVALRHLQNLVVQLPYKPWQVRNEGEGLFSLRGVEVMIMILQEGLVSAFVCFFLSLGRFVGVVPNAVLFASGW